MNVQHSAWLAMGLAASTLLHPVGVRADERSPAGDLEFLRGPVPSADEGRLHGRRDSGCVADSRGWPIFTRQTGMYSPVIGDFDVDYPGDEAIVAVAVAQPLPLDVWTEVFVVHADGSLMDGWAPRRFDVGDATDSPALGDVNSDGTPDLVLGLNYDLPVERTYVTVLRPNGHTIAGRWPRIISGWSAASPVLADLDGDGYLEVLFPSRDGHLHIWHHDGTVFLPNVWPKVLDGVLYNSPAVGSPTRGSPPVIVIGCRPPENAGALLYAFHPDGTLLDGDWPLRFAERRVFTPTIADIDRDGRAEIVIGAADHLEAPGRVYALELDGTLVTGAWPQEIWDPSETWPPGGYPYFISVADLDPDYPGLEIVTAPNYGTEVYAFHADGSAVPGWPGAPPDATWIGNPPVIGDFDDSPGLEVVVGEGAQTEFGRRLYMFDACGQSLPGTPRDVGGFMQVGGVLADLDHDGRLEYIQPVAGTGMIERFPLLGPPLHRGSVVWAMQQYDACRTSFFPDFPEPSGVPDPSLWPETVDLYDNPPGLQVWPGVAGGRSTLHLVLRQPGRLTASLYDIRGRYVSRLLDEEFTVAGEREVSLPRDSRIPSGIYFVRASADSPAGSVVRSVRIVIVR